VVVRCGVAFFGVGGGGGGAGLQEPLTRRRWPGWMARLPVAGGVAAPAHDWQSGQGRFGPERRAASWLEPARRDRAARGILRRHWLFDHWRAGPSSRNLDGSDHARPGPLRSVACGSCAAPLRLRRRLARRLA
jgi:hypothetical protein